MAIPRILLLIIVVNATLAFGFLIAPLFCLGNIGDVLNTNTGYPVIALFHQATGSQSSTTLLMTAIILISFFSGSALLTSVSRLTLTFARDGGLPFSNFFAHVSKLEHPA